MITDDCFRTETLQTVHTEILSMFVFCVVVFKLIEVFDKDIVLFVSLCN